ncbi:MAG: class I SAM-dependent methyltransferase [Methylobacteriaceae bacterium]|nr:class I SAM-dependent methyltransferase [Methylobacteriaceae bacterium]
MSNAYDARFYDWVNMTARRSAGVVLPLARAACAPQSVVDVGCGEGAWLAVWRELGVADVTGCDGAHVDRARLAIPADRFVAADLSRPFTADRRFDLAQSLEVAEHLPPAASEDFVDSLCGLSDVVLFSAAQPGQGGELHVNERRPAWWAERFAARGYACFDALRPALAGDARVDPWYRFNALLFANAAGETRLSQSARAARTAPAALDDGGDLAWRLRRAALAPLPVGVVTGLSRLRYRLVTALGRGDAG